MNINEQLKADAERYGLNSSSNDDWFSFEEGENRVRILLSEKYYLNTLNTGIVLVKTKVAHSEVMLKINMVMLSRKNVHTKPTVKWLLWVIDRKRRQNQTCKVFLQSNATDWSISGRPRLCLDTTTYALRSKDYC